MAQIEIVGYHACRASGGREHIQSKAPFLSGSGRRQWLTQGYYFWTDSDYFAKWWGDVGYKGHYAIVKCKLVIEKEQLLDLVGSVANQLFFLRLMKDFQKRVQAAGEDPNQVTVNDVLSYFRNPKSPVHFPFVAIKSQDVPKNDELPYKGRYPYRTNKKEVMPALTRQQICLFEHSYEAVVEKQIIYPNSLAKKGPVLKGYTLGVAKP